MRKCRLFSLSLLVVSSLILIVACDSQSDEESAVAYVRVKNDFNNPEMERNPPWTICQVAYHGVDFGEIQIGETSEEKAVVPGLDYVLMVMAWDDQECHPEHCLPVASRNEEEVVPGQHRTIAINLPNHQGPCPPEGVQPLPREQYERIRARWPEYGFKPYDQRIDNPQCQE